MHFFIFYDFFFFNKQTGCLNEKNTESLNRFATSTRQTFVWTIYSTNFIVIRPFHIVI